MVILWHFGLIEDNIQIGVSLNIFFVLFVFLDNVLDGLLLVIKVLSNPIVIDDIFDFILVHAVDLFTISLIIRVHLTIIFRNLSHLNTNNLIILSLIPTIIPDYSYLLPSIINVI